MFSVQQYKIGPNDDIKAKKVCSFDITCKSCDAALHCACIGKEGEKGRKERQRKKGKKISCSKMQ